MIRAAGPRDRVNGATRRQDTGGSVATACTCRLAIAGHGARAVEALGVGRADELRRVPSLAKSQSERSDHGTRPVPLWQHDHPTVGQLDPWWLRRVSQVRDRDNVVKRHQLVVPTDPYLDPFRQNRDLTHRHPPAPPTDPQRTEGDHRRQHDEEGK